MFYEFICECKLTVASLMTTDAVWFMKTRQSCPYDISYDHLMPSESRSLGKFSDY